MCGEIDEQERIDEELFERFLSLAGHFGVIPGTPGRDAPAQLDDQNARGAYLEGLFRAGLTRAATDAAALPEGSRMDAVAGQAIAFARLAGFLAGQLPPDSDLFRTAVNALMEGHGEAAKRDR